MEFARDSGTGKHLAGGLSRTETGGIMDGKIE